MALLTCPQALKVLPDDVKLQLLKPFIQASLNLATTACREQQITRGLTQSLKLQVSPHVTSSHSKKSLHIFQGLMCVSGHA